MQTDFLTKLKELDNFTFTENGAVALNSTGNRVLDAFGTLGAMKAADAEDILNIFYAAYNEDPVLSLKLLFYIRDIRGGQGMRRVFRIIARNLAINYPDIIIKNLDNFLFFGRGDDVLCLLDTPIEAEVIKWIGDTLECDMINVDDKGVFPSLLAKWLPSENASSKNSKYLARKIASGLNITPKQYRKMLAKLRSKIGIVETLMSQNKWDEIAFDKLPSKAAMIYSDAFIAHTFDNYVAYLKSLAIGETKVNAGALFPVDIIHKVMEKQYDYNIKDEYLLEAMWNALPNYFGDNEETGLCVVDTSGSMLGTPMEVALSLGMYCADKAKGPFKNHFITFSADPKLQEITGKNIFEKIKHMENSSWMMNTDIEKVFSLILQVAVANNLKQEDLPSKLYIISDMQWDESVRQNTIRQNNAIRYNGWGWSDGREVKPETFISTMRQIYAEHGYDLPALVYWNVRSSKCGMFQQGSGEDNCCMVSGYSPSLFKAVIEGTELIEEEVVTENGEKKVVTKQKIDPVTVMLNTLNNERYNRVVTE